MMESEFSYIVRRIVENATDAKNEDDDGSDFEKGRRLAYYEVLDTIKNELIARGANLKEY